MDDKPKNQDRNEKPEIFSIKQGEQGWEISRREFITAVGGSAVAIAAASCSGPKLFAPKNTETPVPSSTPTKTMTPTSTNTPAPTSTPTPYPAMDEDLCVDMRAHVDEITHLSISDNGKWLVSGGKDDLIKIWTLPSMELIETLSIPDGIGSLAISPDSDLILVLDTESIIRGYAIPSCELKYEIEEKAVAFSFFPDGKYFATVQDEIFLDKADNTKEKSFVYAFNGKKLPATHEVAESFGNIMELSPDRTMVVLAGNSTAFSVYTYPDFDNKQLYTFKEMVDDVKFSADGKFMFVQLRDQGIVQVEVQTKKHVNEFSAPNGFALSKDGSYLIFEEVEGLIQVWSVQDEAIDKSIEGAFGKITALTINLDKTILAAGNENGSMYLWSLPTGTLFSCPIDLDVTSDEVEGVTYEITSSTGETITYTLPCGAPMPAGAVCVCNCVTGSACSCVGYVSCSCDGYSPCSCVGHVTGGSHYWYPD